MKSLSFVPLLLFTVIFWGAKKSPVYSQPKKKLLVLPVDFEMDFSKKKIIGNKVISFIKKYKKFKVLNFPSKDIVDDMMDLVCVDADAECFRGFGKKYGCDILIYGKLTGKKPFTLTLKLVDAKSGSTLKAKDFVVDNLDVLYKGYKKGVVFFFGKVPKPKPKKGFLVLKSEVPGVYVYLNEKKIKSVPAKLKLKPGHYTILAKKKNYKDFRREVHIKPGRKVEVVIKMIPIPVVKPKPVVALKKKEVEKKQKFYEKWWFWTGVGVVAAGIIIPTIYYLNQPTPPKGAFRIIIHPASFQDDVIFKK